MTAFEAHLQQAVLLKKVVDSMKDLCKDVNFDCSERGLQVQSMDSSHVALVSLLLRESAFSEFKCDRPTSLGMNVDLLAKTLKCAVYVTRAIFDGEAMLTLGASNARVAMMTVSPTSISSWC